MMLVCIGKQKLKNVVGSKMEINKLKTPSMLHKFSAALNVVVK